MESKSELGNVQTLTIKKLFYVYHALFTPWFQHIDYVSPNKVPWDRSYAL